MFQVGSINGTGNNATVDYTMFGAGAQTQFNGDSLLASVDVLVSR